MLTKEYKNRLIFKVPALNLPENRNRVRIDPDAMAIVQGLKRTAGISCTKIVSEMIKFSAPLVDFEPEDEEETD